MTIAPGDSSDSPTAQPPQTEPSTHIEQQADRNQGQVIGNLVGGMAIGQLTVYLSQVSTQTEIPAATSLVGDNPYQGLKAFRESDGDRFFGRDRHIQILWDKFQDLHHKPDSVRILPIYGPSGSGKSSLARAGLIPALGQKPLPGRDRARVAVLTPGTHPLEALATVLARIATQDDTPVAKAREFETVLVQTSSTQQHDGLRRIAGAFPDIDALPLIVLVDQFEELYTLCADESERRAFVDNLLVAACDRAQQVSVILTMRSDFLGATQNHPHLNQLFSLQGFLVPSMTPEDLAVAIAAPAKQAGYELDKATVQLLVRETQGQEGALPLLQFALTQIWEGLRQGISPADTLERIGGVGGAVATEAQRIYHSLSEPEQQIARCIFLSLIQLNDDKTATRRRATLSELATQSDTIPLIRNVIYQFARPGVWILVTSANQQHVEMVEVAHEALIQNWQELRDWINGKWDLIRQKRKIEQAAQEWQEHNCSSDYLLGGRALQNARDFAKTLHQWGFESDLSLSIRTHQFIRLSRRKRITEGLKQASIFLLIPLAGILSIYHFQTIDRANLILYERGCTPDSEIRGFLQYMWWTRNANQLKELNLCNEELQGIYFPGSVIVKPNFELANLANTNFRRAVLSYANFRGASLIYADFSNRAFLIGSDFRCSETECTSLYYTNFQDSDLTDTIFDGALLEGTNFNGTNLTGADLRNVRGLTEEQLGQAWLCQTTLPIHLNHIPSDRDCDLIEKISD